MNGHSTLIRSPQDLGLPPPRLSKAPYVLLFLLFVAVAILWVFTNGAVERVNRLKSENETLQAQLRDREASQANPPGIPAAGKPKDGAAEAPVNLPVGISVVDGNQSHVPAAERQVAERLALLEREHSELQRKLMELQRARETERFEFATFRPAAWQQWVLYQACGYPNPQLPPSAFAKLGHGEARFGLGFVVPSSLDEVLAAPGPLTEAMRGYSFANTQYAVGNDEACQRALRWVSELEYRDDKKGCNISQLARIELEARKALAADQPSMAFREKFREIRDHLKREIARGLNEEDEKHVRACLFLTECSDNRIAELALGSNVQNNASGNGTAEPKSSSPR